jgi:hypothetical protein
VSRWLDALLVPSAALLALASTGLAWRFGGGLGVAALSVYVVAAASGVPFGAALFGWRHGAAWISGALLGYAATAACVWVWWEAGLPVAAFAYAAWWALGLLLARRSAVTPLALPFPWTRRDTTALLLAMLIVPLLVGRPFSRIGERDDAGNLRYRSYFTADFVWHMALTAELAARRLPPRDPYAARQPLHYYWTYFLVPAAVASGASHALERSADVLRVNALGAAMLLAGMLFVAAWTAVPRAGPALAGTWITVSAASAEGAYALWRLWHTGGPLESLRTLNIDALTMWWFRGLTIDNLPRTFWYTPQHGGACALGLVALAILASAGASAPVAAILLAGVALGLAVLFSPFLGGLFAVVFGLAVAFEAVRSRRWRCLATHAIAAVPFLIAVAVCAWQGVLEGAGGALRIGFAGAFSQRSLIVVSLALGPVLAAALLGVSAVRLHLRGLAPALAALVVGFLVFFGVTLGGTDPYWAGWRAGNVLLATLPALVASSIVGIARYGPAVRRAAWTVLVIAVAIGVPTTAIDAWNAQDVENEHRGAGFRWTLLVTPAQQAAYAWIRSYTDPRALVQFEPVARGREGWTNVPAFAQRAMAAGLPISLVTQPHHREGSEQVRGLFATTSAREAWATARRLRIDYLYVDRTDRAAHPQAAIAKFGNAEFFSLVFARDDVAIYAVLR